jgi:hypothetical protein
LSGGAVETSNVNDVSVALLGAALSTARKRQDTDRPLKLKIKEMRQVMRPSHQTLLICPRCKQKCLNRSDYGESALYRSQHRVCVPCFHAEDAEIDWEGTNNLPETLRSYGPENDYD